MALTDSGRNLVRSMKELHEILRRLLVLIGVLKEIAANDAEKIEHGLHRETIRKITKLSCIARRKTELKAKIPISSARHQPSELDIPTEIFDCCQIENDDKQRVLAKKSKLSG